MNEPKEGGDVDNVADWVSKQEYVRKHLIAIVVRNSIADIDPHIGAAVKALVEIHPITIATLDNDFTLRETATGPVDALVIKYVPIYSARVPLFRYSEKFGKAITHLVGQLAILQSKYDSNNIHQCSIDVLFIEPDGTGTCAVDAWLCRDLRLKRFTGPSSYRAPGTNVNPDIICSMYWDGPVLHVHHGIEGEVDLLAFANDSLAKTKTMGSNPYSTLTNVVPLKQPT
jgi:hypothetical protein